LMDLYLNYNKSGVYRYSVWSYFGVFLPRL
jgi:hypothetical protein